MAANKIPNIFHEDLSIFPSWGNRVYMGHAFRHLAHTAENLIQRLPVPQPLAHQVVPAQAARASDNQIAKAAQTGKRFGPRA